MSRPGRRAGRPDTKSEILSAAREVFGESGYDRSTVRQIASRAGVDPALIHHYFGSKEDLFAASISLPFNPADVVGQVLEEDLAAAGPKLARVFFTVWENEEPRASLLGVLRTAMGGDERGIKAFREFLLEGLKGRIAPLIGEPDAELRALAIASHLVGIAIVRYVVRMEPMASAEVDEIIELVGPRLQSYLG